MVHEFNTNGYIYTERELKSGKNYKMIMKKAYKISEYHNEKASGRDSDSMQMPQLSQMPVKGSRVLSIPQNIDFTQKKPNSKFELNFVPTLVKGLLPEAENITEKDNIKPQNIDLTQEETKSGKKFYILGIFGYFGTMLVIMTILVGIRIGINLREGANCTAKGVLV